ncbi:HAD-IA family hydrolase [Parabacteroides sp. OttesenSCG-928-O15]|nr:HAD-IA family hydrolase [Parabacteroides sp. OttesenSCG-928-O15]
MINEAVQSYLRKNNLKAIDLKAVLFDMDGVLYDSMPFHARAWKEIADKYNLISSPEDFYLMEGRTGGATIDALFHRTFGHGATEEQKRSIYDEKAALFNSYNEEAVMPGASEMLRKVKEAGMQAILVTGSGQYSLIDKLNGHFPGVFTIEKMVTAYDVKYGKPHPEPYLMGLAKAGVKACEAIVVENAPMGVEAAVAAGIFTIAVNTGPLSDSVLLDAGAGLLYPDMKSLASDWDRLLTGFESANNG